MDRAFIYDRPVTGKNLIGRRNEAATLANFIISGANVVISEPPKTGKTSLIRQTLFNLRVEGREIIPIELSLAGIRSAAELMRRLHDRLAVAFGNSMTGSNGPLDMKESLELPYRLAYTRKCKTLLILDDFQDILLYDECEELCKCLEDIFKRMPYEVRPLCSFIFCGSRINAMKEIFETRRHFHKLVERVRLDNLEEKDIVELAVRGFIPGGKAVEKELIAEACRKLRYSIWYINHLCSICDSLARGYVMRPVMEEAFNTLVAVHEPRFKAMMADLTNYQASLLKAVIDGCSRLGTAEVINGYGLNSSANVKRLKDALCKKEIISFKGGASDEGAPEIIDPLFAWWVENVWFGK